MAARLTHSGSTAPGLVAALVDSGIIAPEDRSRAIVILDGRLRNGADDAPRSTILAEMAGYAGGILVLAAGAVFLGANWRELSTGARVGVLAAGAVLLAAAALGIRLSRTSQASAASVDLRRRLAGVLGLGAAGLTAGALGAYLETRTDLQGAGMDAGVFAAFTAVALAAYLLAPTVPGQAALGFGFVTTLLNLTNAWPGSTATLTRTAALIVVGAGWLALGEAGRWREPVTARLVGGATMLFGAQTPVFEDHHRWLAYILLTLLGILAFAVYLRVRAWPYLAMGVIGLTLAATEAAIDYLPGGVGAASALLVAGAMLLATSLFAMRLHKGASSEAHTDSGRPVRQGSPV